MEHGRDVSHASGNTLKAAAHAGSRKQAFKGKDGILHQRPAKA
jgi:hypothetical protein